MDSAIFSRISASVTHFEPLRCASVLFTGIGYLTPARGRRHYSGRLHRKSTILPMPDTKKPVKGLVSRARRLFPRGRDPKVLELIDTLQHVSIFRNLPKSVIRDLSDAVHVRDYKRDEFLYYERDPGLGMYVVQRGRIRLLVENESGAVHELRQIGVHEFFGKLSLLGDFPRLESAQAISETRVLGFFRPDLKTIIKRHPGSGASIIEAVARNLAATETELTRVLIEKDGKVEARRMVENASARVEMMPSETVHS